jgi:hypothetical protein
MPYNATVFNVLIASPSDVEAERATVRNAILEWNAVHSSTSKQILQPIGWETHSHPSMADRPQGVLNKQIVENADLLVGIFWTRLGTPTGEAASGSVEEVERHVRADKPAMLYFSDAPVHPDSVDSDQLKDVRAFKEQCMARGLVETYDSPAALREKFSRQLASKINSDPYFVSREDDGMSLTIPIVPGRDLPTLSKEAKNLLLEAAEDPQGTIQHVQFIGGEHLQTNRKQFIEQNNPRSRAAWEGALRELEELELIKSVGDRGEVFEVTREGYQMAELMRD